LQLHAVDHEGTSRKWPAIDRNSWHLALRMHDFDGVVERLIAFDITEGLDGDPERMLSPAFGSLVFRKIIYANVKGS